MEKKRWLCLVVALACVFSILAVGCTGPAGSAGQPGLPGNPGLPGLQGPAGPAAESSPASIVVEPMSGKPKTALMVYGAGFVPGENVRIILHMTGTDMAWGPTGSGGIVTANDYGAFGLKTRGGIPAGNVIEPGVYSVEATGDKGSRASTPLVVLE